MKIQMDIDDEIADLVLGFNGIRGSLDKQADIKKIIRQKLKTEAILFDEQVAREAWRESHAARITELTNKG